MQLFTFVVKLKIQLMIYALITLRTLVSLCILKFLKLKKYFNLFIVAQIRFIVYF